jgi:hypothetical protein
MPYSLYYLLHFLTRELKMVWGVVVEIALT